MEIGMPVAPTVGSLESVASQVTTQSEPDKTPQVETPAGAPQAETPAGQEKAAATPEVEATPDQEDQTKSWKEKRQERNRQRWQEYKAAKEVLPQRLASLEAEVSRLRSARPPNFAEITDPNEELAERTAWKVKESLANEATARLEAERTAASEEHIRRMYQAWDEAAEEARARIPDFDDVFSKAAIHARMAPILVDSEKAADVAYWLGKNPKEAAHLYELFHKGSQQALIEFGKLEARLSAPAPKTLSTAPKPAPVLSGGANPLQFDADRASPADMAEQLRKAGIIR